MAGKRYKSETGFRHMTSKIGLFLMLVLAATGIQSARAQVLYGSVVGVVEDPSGGSIAGAEVSVTNQATGQSKVTKSDESGRYQIADLQPGVSDVIIEAGGFRTGVDVRRLNQLNDELESERSLQGLARSTTTK